MKPLLVINWEELPDSPRVTASIMASDLEMIARAIRHGEGAGTERKVIHTDLSIDELREALSLLAPKN